ncbi:MAG: ASPIC/UnbV domain-containing protein [Planctomycetia bacterium]|nr:ASPIC/UnbV domain-containing protein [Planctomycetia bacterium]
MLNTSPPAHFARVRLHAVESEPLALGAIVILNAGGVTQREYVRITDGFMAQTPADLHFGLGASERVDSIVVQWPSGTRQSWKDLPADRLLVLRENLAGAEASELKRWPEGRMLESLPRPSMDISARRLDGSGAAPLGIAGKAAVINFWSPTCAACLEEIPALARVRRRFEQEVQLAGVSVDRTELEVVAEKARHLGADYAQFVADDRIMTAFFGNEGTTPLPATFVFDKSGRLRRMFLRPVEEEDLAMLLESFREEGVFVADLDTRGSLELQEQDFEVAIRTYMQAERLAPGSALRWLKIGLAQLGLGKHAEAYSAFLRSVQLDDQDPQALANLATSLVRLGRAAEAVDYYQKALRIRGEDANTLVNLGNALGIAGRGPEALSVLQRACKADPRSAAAWTGLGKVYLLLDRTSEAIVALEKAVEIEGAAGEAGTLLKKLADSRRSGRGR